MPNENPMLKAALVKLYKISSDYISLRASKNYAQSIITDTLVSSLIPVIELFSDTTTNEIRANHNLLLIKGNTERCNALLESYRLNNTQEEHADDIEEINRIKAEEEIMVRETKEEILPETYSALNKIREALLEYSSESLENLLDRLERFSSFAYIKPSKSEYDLDLLLHRSCSFCTNANHFSKRVKKKLESLDTMSTEDMLLNCHIIFTEMVLLCNERYGIIRLWIPDLIKLPVPSLHTQLVRSIFKQYTAMRKKLASCERYSRTSKRIDEEYHLIRLSIEAQIRYKQLLTIFDFYRRSNPVVYNLLSEKIALVKKRARRIACYTKSKIQPDMDAYIITNTAKRAKQQLDEFAKLEETTLMLVDLLSDYSSPLIP